MNRSTSRLFLTSLIVFAVLGAALILTLPALFGPHVPHQAWLSGLLGGLALVSGLTALALRPPRRTVQKDPLRR